MQRPPFARLLCALVPFLALAPAGATPPPPPGKLEARLSSRVEDGRVRVAIEVEVAREWHLYHTELGHPEALALPTRVTLSGEGITWSEVRFPEPVRAGQGFTGADGEEVWALGHEGRFTLYALGCLAPGAEPGPIAARFRGQVCKDACIPVDERLTSEGPGQDALFAAFPSDLACDGAAAGAAPGADEAWTPPPARDERSSGRADATLWARGEGTRVRAVLRIAIEPGWHLYHTDIGAHPDAAGKPLELELFGRGVTWTKLAQPEPERQDQGFPGADGSPVWILGHEGTIVFRAEGEVAGGAEEAAQTVWARLDGQTCEEVCIDYEEVAVVAGSGDDALFADWEAALRDADTLGAGSARAEGASSATVEPMEAGRTDEPVSLWAFLLSAVGWGLFTLLMPCTYPMIPITISFFTKRAADRHQSALPLALAYGAGIVLVFVLIGVVFGAVIIPFATHPLTNLVIAIVFFYFALVLFGVAKLNPPASLMNLAGKAASTGGYLGVFLMGTTLVLTSFTCTAPFVGTLLATGAKDGELGRVALGMGVFGLTMAVPFVLLSLVPGKLRALPKSGEWMNTLKFFLGFVEVAAALKFLSNVDLVQGWRIISREFFLLGWAVIFLAAAVHLLGIWRPRGERSRVGPVRLASGGVVLLFSGYLLWAMTGQRLDFVMSALAPPYTGGRFFPQWYDEGIVWSRVVDDYEGAVRLAKDEKKLVLLNFTGVTCSVCRNMEENVFPTPEVRKVLGRHYVEARLHTDAGPRMDEFRALEQELADTVANPVYVILDPTDGSTKGQKAGFAGPSTFARFLEAPLQVTN